MRAIDTNVIVRFLTADDEAQAAVARRTIEAGDVFVATTVLLETEWVLRSGYGFSSEAIEAALRGLAGLPGVNVEDPPVLAAALDGLAAGMDFVATDFQPGFYSQQPATASAAELAYQP